MLHTDYYTHYYLPITEIKEDVCVISGAYEEYSSVDIEKTCGPYISTILNKDVSEKHFRTDIKSIKKPFKLVEAGHVLRFEIWWECCYGRWEELSFKEHRSWEILDKDNNLLHNWVYIVAHEHNLLTTSLPDDELATLINSTLEMNPKPLVEYRAGKLSAINAILGIVMKNAKEKDMRIDPRTVKEKLTEMLGATNGNER